MDTFPDEDDAADDNNELDNVETEEAEYQTRSKKKKRKKQSSRSHSKSSRTRSRSKTKRHGSAEASHHRNRSADNTCGGVRRSRSRSASRSSRKPAKHPDRRFYAKQLYALLWKGALIRRIHFISTFFEIIGPILLPACLICAILFTLADDKSTKKDDEKSLLSGLLSTGKMIRGPHRFNEPEPIPLTFTEADFTLGGGDGDKSPKRFTVLYTPNTVQTRGLVKSLTDSKLQVLPVDNVTVLRYLFGKIITGKQDKADHGIAMAGVQFHEPLDLETGMLTFSIYKPTTEATAKWVLEKYPIKHSQNPAKTSYGSYQRVVQLLAYIARDYILGLCSKVASAACDLLRSGTGGPPSLVLRRMPYPEYLKSPEISEFGLYDYIALLLTVGYVLLVPLIVKRVTDEKSTRAKELLTMMGMSDVVFWSSHFITYFVNVVLQAFVLTVLFFATKSQLTSHSSPVIFFIFWILYGAQVVLFSLWLSTLFTSSVIAVIGTIIIWIVAVTGSAKALVPKLCDCPVGPYNIYRSALTLFPTSSLTFFFSVLGDLELKGFGLTFKTLNDAAGTYGNYTPLTSMTLIIISLPMWAMLIFYFDAVWPWQPGIPKSPLFPFKKSYWYPRADKVDEAEAPEMDKVKFQANPKGAKARIDIRNITKSFGSGRPPAVDGLWLKIYDNSLTVLLGHNGAGKSTTMNMITGMFSPTSGTIHVDGFNVATATAAARLSIGLCPQENIHFSELTVSQHLYLFAMLKDFPEEDIGKEISYLLEMLSLEPKRNELACNLSGGMKRKLALGMALVGGTKTLILDEPTSGMDPEARRVIWDVLLSLRRTRTILLTTHYMEEADVLADRIAIMKHGQLCCLGSPMFLKSAFGTGYRLRISKVDSEAFDEPSFREHLRSYFALAELVTEVETEVVYSLETEEDVKKTTTMKTLQRLFDDIEANKEQYGIDSCGLSCTTMEDVFLISASDQTLEKEEYQKYAGGGSRRSSKASRSSKFSMLSDEEEMLMLTPAEELLVKSKLTTSQCTGLLLKRVHFGRRYWPMLVWQLVIPAAIIAFALYKSRPDDTTTYENDVELNLRALYGKGTQAFFCTGKKAAGAKLQHWYKATMESRRYRANLVNIEPCERSEAIDDWALEVASKSRSDYISDYLYGLEAQGRNLTAWFNAEQYHSLPLSLVALFDALLRSVSSSTTPAFKVTTVWMYKNSEVEEKAGDKEKNREKNAALFSTAAKAIRKWIFLCMLFMPLAFPFLGASYVLFPLKERLNKSKLLQLMTGLSPKLYWSANFVFDLATHLVATGILFLVISLSSGDMFTGTLNTMPLLLLLIFAFGFATIPLAYLLSFSFDTPTSGFVWTTILYIAIGLILHLMFAAINLFYFLFSQANDTPGTLFTALAAGPYLLNLVPIFAFLFGYQKIFMMSQASSLCTKVPEEMLNTSCSTKGNPDKDPMMAIFRGCCSASICGSTCYTAENIFTFQFAGLTAGTEVAYLFLSGIVYFAAVVYYEKNALTFRSKVEAALLGRKPKKAHHDDELVDGDEDEDVAAERERVEAEVDSRTMSSLLTVYRLKKIFKKRMVAVDGLSFGVKDNEIFGFLGVNGAGKTTTFSMLVGDLAPTSGDAFISQGAVSLLGNLTAFRQSLGYCPQFDALLEEISGDETLELFASLRGLPKRTRRRDIDRLVAMVGLEEHRSKVVGTYSGGNKRKLSIAVALIGSPNLLLLDEPSAGVDPTARRKIWQLLGAIKRQLHCSVLLTSHSMEECEALCSRIAIMVKGRFVCLGSTQHLRYKFGQGYTVTIRLARKHELDRKFAKKVHKALVGRLPSAVLKDLHQCDLHYHVPDTEQSWSAIFAVLNSLNEQFAFEDYTVTDTTLEQIFITFARHQTDAQEEGEEEEEGEEGEEEGAAGW